MVGLSLGLVIAGAGALARQAIPSMTPLWGNLGPASTFSPLIAAALTPAGSFFTQAILLLIVLYGVRRRPQAAAPIWVFFGLALAGASSIETISSWLIVGTATGLILMLVYYLAFRHQPELVVATAATLVILSSIRDGIQGMFPSALPGALTGVGLVAIIGWLCFRGSMDRSVER